MKRCQLTAHWHASRGSVRCQLEVFHRTPLADSVVPLKPNFQVAHTSGPGTLNSTRPHRHISTIKLQLPMEPSCFNIAEREKTGGGHHGISGVFFRRARAEVFGGF